MTYKLNDRRGIRWHLKDDSKMKLEDTVASSLREGNEDDQFEIKHLSETCTLQLLWRHVLAIITVTVYFWLLVTKKFILLQNLLLKDELKRANGALKRVVA